MRFFCVPITTTPPSTLVRRRETTTTIEPPSSGFQLSPDFRQRASSNASSIGRLSPIPAILGLEPDWGGFVGAGAANSGVTAAANAAQQSDYTQQPGTEAQAQALDQLAGSLADELSLQKDFMQGSVARLSFGFSFGFGCWAL